MRIINKAWLIAVLLPRYLAQNLSLSFFYSVKRKGNPLPKGKKKCIETNYILKNIYDALHILMLPDRKQNIFILN